MRSITAVFTLLLLAAKCYGQCNQNSKLEKVLIYILGDSRSNHPPIKVKINNQERTAIYSSESNAYICHLPDQVVLPQNMQVLKVDDMCSSGQKPEITYEYGGSNKCQMVYKSKYVPYFNVQVNSDNTNPFVIDKEQKKAPFIKPRLVHGRDLLISTTFDDFKYQYTLKINATRQEKQDVSEVKKQILRTKQPQILQGYLKRILEETTPPCIKAITYTISPVTCD